MQPTALGNKVYKPILACVKTNEQSSMIIDKDAVLRLQSLAKDWSLAGIIMPLTQIACNLLVCCRKITF